MKYVNVVQVHSKEAKKREQGKIYGAQCHVFGAPTPMYKLCVTLALTPRVCGLLMVDFEVLVPLFWIHGAALSSYFLFSILMKFVGFFLCYFLIVNRISTFLRFFLCKSFYK